MAGAVKVCDGIHWVGCGSWGGVTEVLSVEASGNVFLVGSGEEFGLVDAGIPPGVGAVLENCSAFGASPGKITRVVLTHPHGDHIAGAPLIREKTGAKMAAAEFLAEAFDGNEEKRKKINLGTRDVFPVDENLAEGDIVRLGNLEFTVMLTPGHIPGSITLAGETVAGKLLFTGDVAIGDQGDYRGVVGWLDGHWSSNPKHMLNSLERIRKQEADMMLPGHGFPIIGAKKVAVSLEHCIQRVEQLLAIPDLRTMMPLDMDD